MAIPGRLLEVRVGPPGLPGIGWRDLYIDVEVDKSKGKQPSKAKATLYNLAPLSISLLEQPGNVLQILAGETYPSTLFTGDIPVRGVQTSKQGVDQVTTIEAGAGRTAYRDSRFVRSYPPGIISTAIIGDIIAGLGVVVGFVAPLPPIGFPSGWAFAGRAIEALAELVESAGGEVSLEDGILEITLKGVPSPGEAVLISALTGMQGSPTRTDKGISAITKLEPSIKPGRAVSVVSRFITGFYRVTRVVHRANSRGLVWSSTVEGVPL